MEHTSGPFSEHPNGLSGLSSLQDFCKDWCACSVIIYFIPVISCLKCLVICAGKWHWCRNTAMILLNGNSDSNAGWPPPVSIHGLTLNHQQHWKVSLTDINWPILWNPRETQKAEKLRKSCSISGGKESFWVGPASALPSDIFSLIPCSLMLSLEFATITWL